MRKSVKPRALVVLALVSIALLDLAAAPIRLAVQGPDWSLPGGPPEGATPVKKAWAAALDLLRADGEGRWRIEPVEGAAGQAGGGAPLLRATVTGGPGAWTALFQLEGVAPAAGAAAPMKYLTFAEPGPSLYLEMARALEALARAAEPARPAGRAALIDSFSVADLVGVDLPGAGMAALSPSALAARRGGELLVACGSAVLEMDARWQVVGIPSRKLNDEGNFAYAYGLALSPAGTLLVRPADGSALYAFPEGSQDYRRLRVESPAGSAFGVMEDGSPFVVSLSPRVARIYREGVPVDLPLAADSNVMAAAAGPEDTIWLADLAKGSIAIRSAEGQLRDIVYPELEPGQSIMKLEVLADGSFFAVTPRDLRRFDRSGRLLWSWDGAADGLALVFSVFTDVAPGPEGTLYVNDYLGKRILRLAPPGAALGPGLKAIAAAAQASRREPSKAGLLVGLADAYEAMGAVEAARAVLSRYLEDHPADAAQADRELRLELSLVSAKAESAAADARSLLARFGPETARDAYGRAMRALESLRSRSPGDSGVARRIAELRALFETASRAGGDDAPLPRVKAVELAALFPALLQRYRTEPAGSLLLENATAEPLRDVSAEVFIQKYMDFPAAGASVPRLEPGAEALLELAPILNERALELQEDLPLQARITVRFTDSRGRRSLELSRPVVLYRKTALTWDDTGKLASFVTPNEETIARFAFSAVGSAPERPLFSTALGRAMAICDNLGSLPLRYVPDPQSPVTTVLGNPTVVDTVRFPRTTLSYRGGDCDDTTALLCSALEAAGIHTAILTSPGHVFLAFDSGEKAEEAWLLEAPGYATLAREGRLWIPLESTVLSKGFEEAWKSASELVAANREAKALEFLSLASQRTRYPALPLPPSALPVPPADAQAAAALDARASAALDAGLRAPVAAALERSRVQARGKDWDRLSNRLAQVEARWGRADRAAAAWNEIVQRDPSYVAAYLNLATLALAGGREADARSWLARAEAAFPGSEAVAAWAARAGLAPAKGPGGGAQAAANAPRASSAGEAYWVGD